MLTNDFLETLPSSTRMDILLLNDHETIQPKEEIKKYISPNNIHVLLYKINMIITSSVHQELSNYPIITFFQDYVKSLDISEEMKDFIIDHSCYFLLYAIFGNRIENYRQHTKRCLELNKVEYDDQMLEFITDIIKDIHGDIINALFPLSNDNTIQFNKASLFLYRDILLLLKMIGDVLQRSTFERIGSVIKDLGSTPIYWPITIKLRLRLFANLREATFMLNMFSNVHHKYPSLHCCQKSKELRTLNTNDIIFLLNSLPKYTKPLTKDDELFKFSSAIYTSYSEITKLKISTDNLRPSTTQALLQQFIVVHQKNWEGAWAKMKWPISIQLFRNILAYRRSVILTNSNFFKLLLFYNNGI